MPRLHVNFASDPFINRVVPLAAIALFAFVALAMTATNLTLFAVFGGEYRTLRSKTTQQQARLVKLTTEVQSRKTEISSPAVATFMGEAAFLDGVLRAKAFSWSLFLARLEEAKAYGVMLQTVNPKVNSDGRIGVSLRGVANPREELLKYENNLFRSNFFRNVTLRGEQKDPSNPWVQFDITADYDPEGYPPQALPVLPPANAPAQNAPVPQAPVPGVPPPTGKPGAAPVPAKIPVPPSLAPAVANAPAPQPPAPKPPQPAATQPPGAPVPKPAVAPPPRATPPGTRPAAGAVRPAVPRGTPSPTKAPQSSPGVPPSNRPATNSPGGAP